MRLDATFVRFVVNGLAATAVHFAVLSGLIEVVHVGSAGLANGIASLFGITASYVGNHAFVFQSNVAHRRALPGFVLLYACVALLHVLVLAIWTDYAGWRYEPGFLLATAGSLLVTFVGNRTFVFAPTVTHSQD